MSKNRLGEPLIRDKLSENRATLNQDELFSIAVLHFDRGEYFEAHEVWEDLWNEASGARHPFLQCLIQVAVALHHARNQNFVGTRKLFASALQYLEKGRSDCAPVDLDSLKERVLDFELALQSKLDGKNTELHFFSLPLDPPKR